MLGVIMGFDFSDHYMGGENCDLYLLWEKRKTSFRTSTRNARKASKEVKGVKKCEQLEVTYHYGALK